MAIAYRENALSAEDFLRLRHAVGWSGDLEQIELSLQRGLYNVAALDGEAVAGMGRLVGDGVMYWYVQDVIVDPAYQGQGIGREIMTRLLAHIKGNSLPRSNATVGLMSAIGKHPFYEKLGFRVRPNEREGPGMVMQIDNH